MTTRIYGASDDLIEFDGDVRGEVGFYGKDDGPGCLLVCSDGTLLEASYGKGGAGIWCMSLLKAGKLFERIDQCTDENVDPYSDVALFHPGLSWAYAAKAWERVT